MTNTTEAPYTTQCECCGKDGARVVVLPCGAFVEFRLDCLAKYERQVAHDNWANAQGLDD